MSFRISVHTEGFEEALKKLDPEIMDAPLREMFRRSGQKATMEIRSRAPVNTGRLRGSIRYTVSRSRPPLWMRVKSSQFYGLFQEYGTGMAGDGTLNRGGAHFPPPKAIDGWARSHGFPNGFVAARAIGKRGGIMAKRFWRNGLLASLAAMQSFAADALRKIEAKWDE